MVETAATIATSFPVAAPPAGLFAHRRPANVRKFLYDAQEPAAFTVQLSEQVEPHLQAVLSNAVARLNAIYSGFSARGCAAHDLLPNNVAASNALRIIAMLAPPIPAQIFPLAGGGIQIEWHHGALDIEIESLSDGSLYIYMAVNKLEFIDEELTDAYEVVEHLKQVRKELNNAIADFGDRSLAFNS